MPDLVMVKTRSFPRAGIGAFYRPAGMSGPRRRGVRGILSPLTGGTLFEASGAASGQPWYVPDFAYNLTNQASPDQIIAANQAANAGIVQAETNPVTGQLVPAAVAYANSTAGAAGAAEQQGMTQSTGSSFANSFDNAVASLTGTGTQVASAPGSIPWGTLALLAALGIGGYFVIKAIR